MPRKRKIVVTCHAFPPGASAHDVAEFVNDALSSWGGSMHPHDPMFHSLAVLSVQIAGEELNVENSKGESP